jgi:low temperature requirement protein LtrA
MTKHLMRGDDAHVGFAELFYDLVFVFAVTQLSHLLMARYDLTGAAETAFLFLAVWWTWIYSTWVLNRLDPEKPKVRGLLFLLMLAGLFLSMSIPRAFGDRGLTFALAYCSMQALRTGFMWSVADSPALKRLYLRIMIWVGAASFFWIYGAFCMGQARVILWGAALAFEYLGPIARFRVPFLPPRAIQGDRVRGGHIAERCALFVIICLGEALLISGAAFAGQEWTAVGLGAFVASVAGTIGLWWVYFHVGHARATHVIEHTEHPADMARRGYTYLHIPIVAGIVLEGVGSTRAIALPLAPASLPEMATVAGGLAMFLMGAGFFKWQTGRYFPLSHIVGLCLTAGLAVVGPWTNLLAVNTLAAVILAQVAVWEHVSLSAPAR